jgi:hypothetical protein
VSDLIAKMGDKAKGKRIEIWFQDEARVGQKTSLVYQWAKRGTRPTQLKDQRYKWAYIFGAICPHLCKAAAWVMPTVNAQTFNKHLEEISSVAGDDAIAIVILDRAGWHGAKTLNIPENICLMPLPPYSPELNPIENVWQYLRQNYLSTRVFESDEEIIDACYDAWMSLINLPDVMKSITERDWANYR